MNIKKQLKLMKYSKAIQTKNCINIEDYKKFSGRYIIKGKNDQVKIFSLYTNILLYKGKYLNDKKNGKGKEYKSYNFIDDVHDIKNSSNKNKILHNLCKKCNEENKKNKNIFCVICDKNHINIDIKDKDLNDTEKNNNGDEKQDINNVKIVHENKKNNDNEAPKIDQKIKVKINKNNPPSTENNYNINAKDKKIYVNKKEETKNCDKTKDENSQIKKDIKDDNKPKRNDKNDKVICRECIIY